MSFRVKTETKREEFDVVVRIQNMLSFKNQLKNSSFLKRIIRGVLEVDERGEDRI